MEDYKNIPSVYRKLVRDMVDNNLLAADSIPLLAEMTKIPVLYVGQYSQKGDSDGDPAVSWASGPVRDSFGKACQDGVLFWLEHFDDDSASNVSSFTAFRKLLLDVADLLREEDPDFDRCNELMQRIDDVDWYNRIVVATVGDGDRSAPAGTLLRKVAAEAHNQIEGFAGSDPERRLLFLDPEYLARLTEGLPAEEDDGQ